MRELRSSDVDAFMEHLKFFCRHTLRTKLQHRASLSGYLLCSLYLAGTVDRSVQSQMFFKKFVLEIKIRCQNLISLK